MVHLFRPPCQIPGVRLVASVSVPRALSRFNSIMRVLCVAEKPSIAKAVAGHLSGGEVQTVRVLSFGWEKTCAHILSIIHPKSISRTMSLIMILAVLGASVRSP